jgi:sugar lactone lactonase YvrE
MSVAKRVSIQPAPKRAGFAAEALPLLDTAGAHVVLGSTPTAAELTVPIAPTERTMFAPRGVCIAHDGSLWVADTGHHRVLGWPVLPGQDGEPASLLLGQPSFCDEGRNAKGAPGPATCNVPTGIAACGHGIAVADAWNHRVLIWLEIPRHSQQPADLVLGQDDFHSVAGNRGADTPTANSLFWPFGVTWDGARLWVADTGNRRVLMWQGMPERCGQPADQVLGQRDFTCRDENAGGRADAASMRWPHAIACRAGGVCVTDAGNSRVMIWHSIPSHDGQACDAILGQQTWHGADHNQGDYWPGPASLNMPYGLAATEDGLWVADTANSRLLGWQATDLRPCGSPASRLSGQPDWQSKGENRWRTAERDSLCWPFTIALAGESCLIADAGNNRVLIWRRHADAPS